jgi:hypothetical protein
VFKQRLSLLRKTSALIGVGGFAVLSVGCTNYRDQLQRGQGYYEQNQYEAALAIWRNVEPDQSALTRPEMVRYCYLRGMTDFRLGYRDDARYWLGLAKAATPAGEPALQPDEAKRLEETLAELNADVFGLAKEEGTAGETLGDSCQWTSDCDTGYACQEGTCVQADGADLPDDEQEPAATPAGGGQATGSSSKGSGGLSVGGSMTTKPAGK